MNQREPVQLDQTSARQVASFQPVFHQTQQEADRDRETLPRRWLRTWDGKILPDAVPGLSKSNIF